VGHISKTMFMSAEKFEVSNIELKVTMVVQFAMVEMIKVIF